MGVRRSSLLIVAAVAMCSAMLSVRVATQAAPQQPPGQPAAPLPGASIAVPQARYVGSTTCRTCHAAIYERWSKTRMANVVTDPKQHPEVVLPDFSKPDPMVTFKLDQVAFVYGTKWKQRYFT